MENVIHFLYIKMGECVSSINTKGLEFYLLSRRVQKDRLKGAEAHNV